MILTREKLEQIYAYYKDMDKVQPLEEYSKRLYYSLRNTNMKSFRFFSYLIDAMEYNSLPTILDDREFGKLSTSKLYRGTPDINNHANLLVDFDYHKGCGVLGSGIYATDNIYRARTYANEDRSLVLTFKLSPDTKIIDHDYLRMVEHGLISDIQHAGDHAAHDHSAEYKLGEMAQQNYKTLIEVCKEHKGDQGFEKFLIDNLNSSDTIAAILLGYDAVSDNNYIVLNRGKIIVSESEFKRITDASKNYKGGVIDFESKSEDDFLRE